MDKRKDGNVGRLATEEDEEGIGLEGFTKEIFVRNL